MEQETHDITCNCGVRLKITSSIIRGFSDHEMVVCPVCHENICEIRADMGYEIEIIK